MSASSDVMSRLPANSASSSFSTISRMERKRLLELVLRPRPTTDHALPHPRHLPQASYHIF